MNTYPEDKINCKFGFALVGYGYNKTVMWGCCNINRVDNVGAQLDEDNLMAQYDHASTLMDDIDPQLRDFLRSKVNSFIKWDLVRFFHDNPHTAETAENVARYTGRDVRTVEDELDDLVKAGVLQVNEIAELRIFSLVDEPQMRDLVNDFVLACDDRQFRVKAIYHVIRGMR